MTTDFEQRLRSEMSQVAVCPRPGLVRQAYQSYRGRRRTARAVAAIGTATAAAAAGTAAALAVTAGPAGGPAAGPAETTAYVVSHVSSALAVTGMIDYTSVHFTAPKNALPAFVSNVTDAWRFGNRFRELTETNGGQLRTESWVRTGRGKPTLIYVDYSQRTWGEYALSGSQPPAGGTDICRSLVVPVFSTLHMSAADWKSIIESGLRCGLYRVAGHQRVNGVDAIKLTTRPAEGGTVLWVDPHTYLPVRMETAVQVVTPRSVTPADIWTDFHWLPPTRVNLAQLTATIPAGFRHVNG